MKKSTKIKNTHREKISIAMKRKWEERKRYNDPKSINVKISKKDSPKAVEKKTAAAIKKSQQKQVNKVSNVTKKQNQEVVTKKYIDYDEKILALSLLNRIKTIENDLNKNQWYHYSICFNFKENGDISIASGTVKKVTAKL